MQHIRRIIACLSIMCVFLDINKFYRLLLSCKNHKADRNME